MTQTLEAILLKKKRFRREVEKAVSYMMDVTALVTEMNYRSGWPLSCKSGKSGKIQGN